MARTEASPRTIRLLTAVLLLFTFAAGTVTGAGLSRWAAGPRAPFFPGLHPPPFPGPPPPPFLSPRVLDELDLTEEQHEKAVRIMERRRPELEAILRETRPKVRAVDEQMEQELRRILTPEQIAKLDRLAALRPGAPGGPPLGALGGPPPGVLGGPPPGVPGGPMSHGEPRPGSSAPNMLPPP